ncbi:MAG TPA: DUF6582 domain-containing protein [Stellaceae bacterium]|nr:DUF6582 domain-containing protein [Stellaceae bacterium]
MALDAGADDPELPDWPPAALDGAATKEPFNSPVQIWACGVAEHRHLAKADAVRCLEAASTNGTEANVASASVRPTTAAAKIAAAVPNKQQSFVKSGDPEGAIEYADPGYQPDGKKRYPIDTERHIRAAWSYINKPANARRYNAEQLKQIRAAIIAAWKAEIDENGPPSSDEKFGKASAVAMKKALWDVCRIVRMMMDLEWLKDMLDDEAAVETDESPQRGRVRAITLDLCDFLSGLVSEDIGEMLGNTEASPFVVSEIPAMLVKAAGAPGIARFGALLQRGTPNMRKLAVRLLMKAEHSQGDQALLDMAHFACEKCLGVAGLATGECEKITMARDQLRDVGANPAADSEIVSLEDEGFPSSGAGPDAVRMLNVIASCLSKRGSAHQCMMDIAHDCLVELTAGVVCGAAKIAARHSKETMLHLRAAHECLVSAGASCHAAGGTEAESLDSDSELGKSGPAASLAKRLTDERAEKAVLTKALGQIVPMLEQLTKRVDDIARTPLPPLTVARNTVSISKQHDGRPITDSEDQEFSSDTLAAALARLSKEEQTLTLIKASYANPIRVVRSTAEAR